MTYRDYYKSYYGEEFSSEFDVHHIDFNRNNNDISNLLLLPKDLHRRYHKAVYKLHSISDGSARVEFDVRLIGSLAIEYNLEVLEEYINCIDECRKWIARKAKLDVIKMNKELEGGSGNGENQSK